MKESGHQPPGADLGKFIANRAETLPGKSPTFHSQLHSTQLVGIGPQAGTSLTEAGSGTNSQWRPRLDL